MIEVRDLVVRIRTAARLSDRVEAYGRLIELFRDMACGCSYSLLGDAHLAEDAAHEAFITAFDKLGQLEEPEAFPGWFRQIVVSQCGRIMRRRRVNKTSTLEHMIDIASDQPSPHEQLAQEETRNMVAAVLDELPAAQREVMTLFYIGGHSQREVAYFLGVSLFTVKNRLNAARKSMKAKMLHMVEHALAGIAPSRRFDQKITDKLLKWPRLLEWEGHPVRQVYDALRIASLQYEAITGEEIVERGKVVNPWMLQFAFPVGEGRYLRPETTFIAFDALEGRVPPVRLMTAGRAFRACPENSTALSVFHQCDFVCIENDGDEARMKQSLAEILAAVLGPVELRFASARLPALSPCYRVEACLNGRWRGVCGCGMFKAEYLRNAGYDPDRAGGHVIAMELENLAMLKYGIDDVRTLWKEPYVVR